MTTRSYQGKVPLLGEWVFIGSSAVLVGDIETGADSSVQPLVVIRGGMRRIYIGQRSSIQDGSVLRITHTDPFNPDGFPLSIGDEVTVKYKVLLHSCNIDNRALVEIGLIVINGAVIEDEVIPGADDLVPLGKVLESGFLYVDSLAKGARPLSGKERDFFAYTTDNYMKLEDLHTAEDYHA